MKIQHYCYTRTKYLDYGDFVIPSNLSVKELDIINRKILSITADNNLRLTVPKWLLINMGDKIIWGCCCSNSMLVKDKEKSRDYSGTPVYGFFSIVISDYSYADLKIPYDIRYFYELYSLEVEPFWNRREEHTCGVDYYIAGNFKYIAPCRNNYVDFLNTDNFRCQSLGELDKDGVIAAAMTLDNVSLLIDNDNIEQAINKNGPFMNCLSTKVPSGEYGVKQKCPQCGKFVSAFADGGICTECKESESIRVTNIKKEEEMDKQLKEDLDMTNRKIEDLESIIELDKNSLKKKGLIIKILLSVIIVLLLALSYAYKDSFSLNRFWKNIGTNSGQNQETPINPSDRYFSFNEDIVNVDGQEHIGYIKFCTNMDVSNLKVESNRDWITANIQSDNLYLFIAPNDKGETRIGEIVISHENEICDSIEIRQSNERN